MTFPSNYSHIIATMDETATQDGGMFRAYVKTTVAASGTRYILVKTPTDKAIVFHSRKLKARQSPVDVQIFSSPTTTANGTLQTKVFNLNSVLPKTTTGQFFLDPTVTADGTEIDVDILAGGGQGQVSAGGFGEDLFERIIPANATFLVKFTNVGATDVATVLYEVVWQEFTL